MALEQEHDERPAIRRFGSELVASAFVEGWGLYSERLADEIGLFESDYERLGMLELQALRAVRLVVDTGIHAHGWDRERARTEMARSGMAPDEIAIEVDRYAALPGQALTYKVGQPRDRRPAGASARARQANASAADGAPASCDRRTASADRRSGGGARSPARPFRKYRAGPIVAA